MKKIYYLLFLLAFALFQSPTLISCGGGGTASPGSGGGGGSTPTPGSGASSTCSTAGCSVSCNTSACSATCTAANCTATCSADYCASSCTGVPCTSSCTGFSCTSSSNGAASDSTSTGSSSNSECTGDSCSSRSDGAGSSSSATGAGSSSECAGSDCTSSRSDSETISGSLPELDPSNPDALALSVSYHNSAIPEAWFFRVIFNDAIEGPGFGDHYCEPYSLGTDSLAPTRLRDSDSCNLLCGSIGGIGTCQDYLCTLTLLREDNVDEYGFSLQGNVPAGSLVTPCEHHSDDGPSNCDNYQKLSPVVSFESRNIDDIDITCCHFGEGRPSSTGVDASVCNELLGNSIPNSSDIPSIFRRVVIPSDAHVSATVYNVSVSSSPTGWINSSLDGEAILCKVRGNNTATSSSLSGSFFDMIFYRPDAPCDDEDVFDGSSNNDLNRFYEDR